MRKLVKQAVLFTTSALGIKPVDRRWVAALGQLNGKFERTGSDLAFYVYMLVMLAGVISMLVRFAIMEYRQSGWANGALFLMAICVLFLCLAYLLISRLGLKYVFNQGTVSAFNTWGQLMWSEDLTGIKGVTFFSGRGTTTMTLYWPDRKRSLDLIRSLKDALDASIESSKQALETSRSHQVKEDDGPSWICPGCHEENPGNFDECWKCPADRPK